MKAKLKKPVDSNEDEENYVRLEDIVISDDFKRTHTNKHKIENAEYYYINNGHFDKPISVIAEINEKGLPNELFLIDEYSRYQAAKRLGLEFVQVKYISIDEYVTY